MDNKIKIGISAKIKGDQFSVHTKTFVSAVKHWFQTTSSDFELIWCNDEATRSGGKKAAQFLLDSGVKAVVGHFASEAAMGALEVYAKTDIPVLLPAATANELLKIHNYTYRVCPNDNALANYMVKLLEKKYKNISLQHDDSNHGKNIINCIESLLPTSSLRSCNNGLNSELVLYSGNFQNSHQFFQENKSKAKGNFVFTDDLVHENFPRFFKGYKEAFVFGYKPFIGRSKSNDIDELFKKEFPSGIGTYYGETIAALEIISQSVESNRIRIKEDQAFKTVLGFIKFENRESNLNAFTKWQIDEDGRFCQLN